MAVCTGMRDTTKICEAELTFRVMPFPNAKFREMFFARGERLNLPVREFVK